MKTTLTIPVEQRPRNEQAKALLGHRRATAVHRNKRRDAELGRGRFKLRSQDF